MQQEVSAQSKSSVSEILRAMVKEYMVLHPRVTVQSLASRAQVPVTTLRRFLQEETKTEVAPHTVLNLCAYMKREKNVAKLLNLLPVELKEHLEKVFGSFVFEGAQERVFSLDLNEVLKDRTNYFIYKLAANHKGTDWSEIQELFGAMGVKKTQTLVEMKVLIVENDIIKAAHQDFSLDLKTAATHLPELVSLYKPESLARGLNLMYSLSESLSEEAIKEVKDIQREAAKATHAIMSNPKKQGHIPYFTINLCETFLTGPHGVMQ